MALLLVAGAAAFGVGGLILLFPNAFSVMKLAGALYLIWVGWNAFRSSFASTAPVDADNEPQISGIAVVLKALLISLSNPKSILFLSAVFPTFLDPHIAIVPQFAVLFAVIVTIVASVHATYAILALRMRSKLISKSGRRWTQRISGLTFAGLGTGLFLDAIRSR